MLKNIYIDYIDNNLIVKEDDKFDFAKQLISLKVEEGASLSLYINNILQWNSMDEVIYHEIMTLPYLNYFLQQYKLNNKKINVLVLGGGDGFIVRELARYNKIISSIKLIDIDNNMIELHKTNNKILKYNKNALNYNKLEIEIRDAFDYIEKEDLSNYDLIINDLVDPDDVIKDTKLYSKDFYNLITTKMSNSSIFISHLGDTVRQRKTYKKVIKNLSVVNKKETKITYFVIPTFGYYSFYTYFKGRDIKDIFEIKIENYSKKIKFLNNKNFKAYKNLKGMKNV